MVQSKIFVHIINLDGNQFQWFVCVHSKLITLSSNQYTFRETHKRTFQILKPDTFDDCRKKLIAKLSSKKEFKDKYTEISHCLKCHHKLKVFVNKRLTNKDSRDDIDKLLTNFRTSTTQFSLHQNIHSIIQMIQSKTNNNKSCAECIYFIESETNISSFSKPSNVTKTNQAINVKSNQIKTAPPQSRKKSKTISKRTRKKKRTRNEFEEKMTKSKECTKKAKIEHPLCEKQKALNSHKVVSKEVDAECIWLLIDMAQTMSTEVFDFGTKCRVARSLIQKMVETNWKKAECKANHFRLFSFSNTIKDLTNEPYVGYSVRLSKLLMDKLHGIGYEEYERCMSYKQALDGLIDIIATSKKMKYGLDKNRILLFTDAERSKCGSVQHLDLKNKLRRNKIVLDCIHITKSKREHNKLKELCEDGDCGKYWNPINKTMGNYDAIMNAEIMTDVSLRNAAKAVIEIDLDSD